MEPIDEARRKCKPANINSSETLSADKLPITIAEWDRNAREVVRLALAEYNGRATINCRVWYRDGDTLKPTKLGITLSLKYLPKLAAGFASALDKGTRARFD